MKEATFWVHNEYHSADKDNFYKESTADFTTCDRPDRDPDYVSDSGSKYWYTKEGVIRESNHWGQVASCVWSIDGIWAYLGETGVKCGFCNWNAFSRYQYDIEKAPVSRVYKNGHALLKNKRLVTYIDIIEQ